MDTCSTCGIDIVYGSRPHNTIFDCLAALKRERNTLKRQLEAQRIVIADLEADAKARKVEVSP